MRAMHPEERKQTTAAARTKLLDSVYLLLAALAVVAVIGVVTAFFIAYKDAVWMPHGDRATQLFGAVFGFGFGVAYLYVALQSHRLQRTLAGKPYLKPLMTLNTQWWVSLSISVIGFVVAIYSLALFVSNDRATNASSVSALIQLLGGTVLILSGGMFVAMTLRVRSKARLSASNVVFGLLLPAVLIVSGIARVIAGCWRLIR
jgi:hypothetical protein